MIKNILRGGGGYSNLNYTSDMDTRAGKAVRV